MKKTERMRESITGSFNDINLKQHSENGWKLVAVEWEREVESVEDELPSDIPFGLRVSADTKRLEEDPDERELIFALMELMVQEGSYARIADEINRRGFRTRQGTKWSPVSVFEMLPRLIEVGPHVFHSEEWQRRRQRIETVARANS